VKSYQDSYITAPAYLCSFQRGINQTMDLYWD